MTMNRYALALTALLAAGGTLSGCGRKDAPPSVAPAGVVTAAPSASRAGSGPVTGGAMDGSLPDTTAALAVPGGAPVAKASPPSTMSRDQESKSMPLPGQANDHSVLVPPKAKGN